MPRADDVIGEGLLRTFGGGGLLVDVRGGKTLRLGGDLFGTFDFW